MNLDAFDEDITTVTSAYHSLGSIKATARRQHISEQKVRKILITAGVLHPERTQVITSMLDAGKSIQEIAQSLGIRQNTVHSYLPYSKAIYNSPNKSNAARLTAACRARRSKDCV